MKHQPKNKSSSSDVIPESEDEEEEEDEVYYGHRGGVKGPPSEFSVASSRNFGPGSDGPVPLQGMPPPNQHLRTPMASNQHQHLRTASFRAFGSQAHLLHAPKPSRDSTESETIHTMSGSEPFGGGHIPSGAGSEKSITPDGHSSNVISAGRTPQRPPHSQYAHLGGYQPHIGGAHSGRDIESTTEQSAPSMMFGGGVINENPSPTPHPPSHHHKENKRGRTIEIRRHSPASLPRQAQHASKLSAKKFRKTQ
eukprot:UN34194